MVALKREHFVFVSPFKHHYAHSGARRRAEALCSEYALDPNLRVTLLAPWDAGKDVEHIQFDMEGGLLRRAYKYIILNLKILKFSQCTVISESTIAPISTRKRRVFHMIHDAKFLTAEARRSGNLAAFIHKLSCKLAEKVITVSNEEKRRIISLLKLSEEQVIVSYNGILNSWIEDLPRRQKEKTFDVLYVSNFASHKGHLELLEIARHFNWRLAFVGADFGTLVRCQKYINDHDLNCVVYNGLSDKELMALFDQSKCFVFPSRLEGFGMPFVEARARGLPVVANDIPVFHELKEKLEAVICDFSDIEGTGAMIEAELNNTPGQPDAIWEFSWHKIAQDLRVMLKS